MMSKESQDKNQMTGQPKRRLGRGINGLLRGSAVKAEKETTVDTMQNIDGLSSEISVELIGENPFQPRKEIDENKLSELSDSIKRNGILQPLIVTQSTDQQGRYILIAGQRRLKAAIQAGLTSVPCVVRQATNQQILEWAMIENIQRSDLNPVEKAEGYSDYMVRFSLTQDEVAERMGQARSTVANYLRLLDLAEETKDLVISGQLSFGHARVLAALTKTRQVMLARKTVRDGISVRKLEHIVSAKPEEQKIKSKKGGNKKAPYIADMEKQLTEAVGLRVTIQSGRKENSGRITIDYSNLEQFDHISSLLGLKIED
jgi:ParB family chromosome partitioning protein